MSAADPVFRRLLVLACTLALTAGCTLPPDGPDGGASPAETWDLTEPPTREDAGMSGDRSTVVHEHTSPTEVRFELPEGVVLQIPLVHLGFDTLGDIPTTANPTGMDMRTGPMTLAKLVPEYRSTLNQLGMRTGRVRKFEYRAGSTTTGHAVRSRTSTRSYGYLRLTVTAYFETDVQRGDVTVVGEW